MSDPIWTYDRFEPGQSFGEVTIPLDTERTGGWAAIYGPPTGPDAPDGMIVAGVGECFSLWFLLGRGRVPHSCEALCSPERISYSLTYLKAFF